MNRAKLFVAVVAMVGLTGFFGGGREEVKLTTPSGFETDAWIYPAEGDERTTGVVFLHGKRGHPGSTHNARFISEMTDLGFKVVAPLMPYSQRRGYEGTREQGLETISAAAEVLDKDRVVVIGHSMGAMAALQYGAGDPAPVVAGLVAVAPGRDPNTSGRQRRLFSAASREACQLMASGRGNERDSYPEVNRSRGEYEISATAEFYCTYYSTSHYPNSQVIGRDIALPTFIIAGARDPLARVYATDDLFASLPETPRNRYETLRGGHKKVLYLEAPEVIAGWTEQLD